VGRYCKTCGKSIQSEIIGYHVRQGHSIDWSQSIPDSKCDITRKIHDEMILREVWNSPKTKMILEKYKDKINKIKQRTAEWHEKAVA